MARKDDRKAARLAKKQQKNQNYQQHQQRKWNKIQVSTANNKQVIPTEKKPVVVAKVVKRPKVVDSEEDEEILSDFSLEGFDKPSSKDEKVSKKLKDKKETKKSKKAKVEKESSKKSTDVKSSKKSKKTVAVDDQVANDGEFDFMDMIDAAYSSGKLTKEGLQLEDGEEDNSDFSFDEGINEEYESSEEGLTEDEGMASEEEESLTEEAKPTAAEIVTPSATAWRPKSLLKAKATEDDEPLSDASARLLKQIQSQINKLSTSNLCAIAAELESFFPGNRRKEVIQMIADTLLAQLTRPGGNLLDAFTVNFAALTVLLYRGVGVEFGAHVMEELITKIDSFYASAKDFDGSLQSHPERSLINCITFASFLCDLGFSSSKLITDLIEEASSRLAEIDIEIILKLFKCSGQKLRKENPDFFKYITGKLRAAPSSNMRFKFMLEQIDEMQGSKRKLAEASTASDDLSTARKAIKSFSTARGLIDMEPLQITISDIRDISTKGKWWLIGSSWAGNSVNSTANTSTTSVKVNAIEDLAKKHHMSTDLRKAIFSAIVSSEDASEAFASLLALKLNGKQEKEINLVLLHCAGQEKKFNPFYAVLAGKLAAHSRSFAMTFQYCLWDSLKALPEWPLRKCSNLARLFGSLLAQGCLPLSALRKAGWIRLGAMEQAFWQLLFKALFDGCKDSDDLLDKLVSKLQLILQKRSESRSDEASNPNRVVKLLTAKTDVSAFDDDFFNSTTGTVNGASVSQQKWEECKALRDGLVYFLDAFCIKIAAEGLPFADGHEAFKRNCIRFKRLLSEI